MPPGSLVSSFSTPEPSAAEGQGGQQQAPPSSVPSSFGIAYRPMRAPQPQEPYGASSQHQRDLETLLEDATSSDLFRMPASTSKPGQGGDDDFDDFSMPIEPSAAVDIASLVIKAQREAMGQDLPPAQAPTRTDKQETGDEDEGDEEEEDEEDGSGKAQIAFQPPTGEMGLRAAAEAALHMLTDTYSRGFGDLEVSTSTVSQTENVTEGETEPERNPEIVRVDGPSVSCRCACAGASTGGA